MSTTEMVYSTPGLDCGSCAAYDTMLDTHRCMYHKSYIDEQKKNLSFNVPCWKSIASHERDPSRVEFDRLTLIFQHRDTSAYRIHKLYTAPDIQVVSGVDVTL